MCGAMAPGPPTSLCPRACLQTPAQSQEAYKQRWFMNTMHTTIWACVGDDTMLVKVMLARSTCNQEHEAAKMHMHNMGVIMLWECSACNARECRGSRGAV
jgi:hypothetical protein